MTDRAPITDEMLAALADGRLGPADAARLRAAIAADPALDRRLAAVVATRRAIAAVYRDTPDAPVPEPPPAALPRGLPRPGHRRTIAIAASVALAVGAVAGFQAARLGGGGGASDPLGAPGPVLAAALENAASGQVRGFAGGSLVVRHTHAIAGGGHCRDYALLPDAAGADAMLGIACRTDDGAWRTRLALVLPASDDEVFRPAGAAHPLLRALLESLQAGPALDAASEAVVIGRGWR
jgi:hypothetical protein